MGRRATALLAAAAGVAIAAAHGGGDDGAADNVLDLVPGTFKQHVGKDLPAFVAFMAPWCGHCKALKPDWAVLAETFTQKDGIVIAKVDADAHKDLATEYDVKGFPTIKYFPAGSTKAEDYNGGRSLDELVTFVNGKVGASKKPKKAPSAVVDLLPSNFDAVVGQPGKHALVEFFAPWCGHCKQLAPTYEKLGAVFAGEPNVIIAKVDADAHRDLGSKFGVSGFPTLKWFPAGDAPPSERVTDYEGGRSLQDLVDHVNEHAGTHRDAKGGLLPTAGRIAAFDELAATFAAATTAGARKAAAAEAAELAAGAAAADKASAEQYVKVMGKAMEKEGYVAKEAARVAGLLSSDAITPLKKTELQLRANVLAAFLPKAAGGDSEAEL